MMLTPLYQAAKLGKYLAPVKNYTRRPDMILISTFIKIPQNAS